MVAAYIKENEVKAETEDNEFFMSILKFYGEEFENQTKSIVLRQESSCFISLEETMELIKNTGHSHEIDTMNNLLRIFDPR